MNTVTITIANLEALGVNPWCTKDATPTKAKALMIACLVDKAGWSEACASAGIKYSRGWLIVRWAELMLTNKKLIVGYKANAEKATDLYNLSTVAQELRALSLSWGEIAVRTGQAESKVRQAYNAYAGVRAEGQRIGHGGRYLAARPDLYAGNMKREGAMIPHTDTVKIKPSVVKVEQLLNFEGKPKVKKARKPSTPKAKVVAPEAPEATVEPTDEG